MRTDPDKYAALYPCDYSAWRLEAIVPRRTVLRHNEALAQAAIGHSDDMAKRHYFSHPTPEGVTFVMRTEAAGFTTYPVGENIAAGFDSPLAVTLAWMCSKGHRFNILECKYDVQGMGYAFDPINGFYYTQDFGCTREDYMCDCPITESSPPPPAHLFEPLIETAL
jgi:hypothetical protein